MKSIWKISKGASYILLIFCVDLLNRNIHSTFLKHLRDTLDIVNFSRGTKDEEDEGKRYRVKRTQNRETENGIRILPGVTNALPRAGEVSGMFMSRIAGLPIVLNGPRPRCGKRSFFPVISEKFPSSLLFVVPSIRGCDLRTYFVPPER